MSGLTAKQQAFINHYILSLNDTEAARLAGYKGNDSTLAVVACENLRKPKIRQQIDGRLKELTVTADETLARVSAVATTSFEDILTFEDDKPRLDLAKAKRLGKLGAIKKYKETENRRVSKDGEEFVTIYREVELYAADAAQDKLMRYHGLYNDKVVHTWQQEVIDLIKSGRITVEQARQELGDELATELFKSASLPGI